MIINPGEKRAQAWICDSGGVILGRMLHPAIILAFLSINGDDQHSNLLRCFYEHSMGFLDKTFRSQLVLQS